MTRGKKSFSGGQTWNSCSNGSEGKRETYTREVVYMYVKLAK